MAKLVVLSTPLQFEKFLHEGFDLKEFEIWCDDERHYDFFEKRGVPFNKLEEDLIAEHWEKINTWSCETAARWIAFCRNNKVFSEIDWATVICIFHGYLLAPILKFYHFSEFLMRQGEFDCVILFSGYGKKDYPQFSGNSYLNYFLERRCKTLGVSMTKIDLRQESCGGNWQPETRSYVRTNIFPGIKKIINKVYAFFAKPGENFDVLAFGSLRHLSSTIRELNKKGIKAVLYDFEFHTDQFLFSLREGIAYLLPECFPSRIHIDPHGYAEQVAERFNQAFKLCANTDLFVYEGIDLKEFVQNHLFASMQAYFLKSAERINHYKNITAATRIKSVLVDDDFSIKGGIFAGYFASIKVPVFCVSHANFAVNANVSKENCNFYQSYTLVNSGFEKANYIRRGWEPNRLIVTGTPRYGRLISLTEDQRGVFPTLGSSFSSSLRGAVGDEVISKPRSPRPFGARDDGKEELPFRCKILFCGTGLWSFSPDVYSYIGHHRECFGQVQTPALEAVFSVIKDLPVELVIKPHSFEMIPLWKRFIEKSAVRKQITLKRHSDDIFQLLMECDAMILAYWSTTIIESAIANKPTIYIDFRKIKNPLLDEYSGKGFCYVVNSKSSLSEAIQKVCNREYSFFRKPISAETRRYYLGECDAKASERVSDFMIEELGDFPASQPRQSFRAPDRARS